MNTYEEMHEDTSLYDQFFPFNLFPISSTDHVVLPMHWHQHFEILVMKEGQAVFQIGNQSFPVAAGDILLVNGGQLHSGYSLNDTCVKYTALVFNKAILGNQLRAPTHGQYISSFLGGQLQFPNQVHQEEEHYLQLRKWIELIAGEFKQMLPGYQFAITSYLQLILIAMVRYYFPEQEGESTVSLQEKNVQRFQNLFNYIKEHYSAKITLEQAADIVNLSPHHFCRTFKTVTGSTFIQFLNRYRINEAEELLRKTTLSITQIAEQVGFCNINYFDKKFKQLKRYPPSRSRK